MHSLPSFASSICIFWKDPLKKGLRFFSVYIVMVCTSQPRGCATIDRHSCDVINPNTNNERKPRCRQFLSVATQRLWAFAPFRTAYSARLWRRTCTAARKHCKHTLNPDHSRSSLSKHHRKDKRVSLQLLSVMTTSDGLVVVVVVCKAMDTFWLLCLIVRNPVCACQTSQRSWCCYERMLRSYLLITSLSS